MIVQKRKTGLNWDDLRFFLAVARSGTALGAANALQVNHATVSRRIDGLEQSLGSRLFDRKPDGYHLTPEGEALFRKLPDLEQTIDALSPGDIQRDGLHARLVLSLLPSLGEEFVIPALDSFHRQWPGIALTLQCEERNESISRREADLGLRLGRPQTGTLKGRKLGTLGYWLAGRPELVRRFRQGEAVPAIGYVREQEDLPEALWISARFAPEQRTVRANTARARKEAARAGSGLALLPGHLLAGSDLLPVTEGSPVLEREIWLLMREDVASLPAPRALIDWLAGLFQSRKALLAGPLASPLSGPLSGEAR